MLEDCFFFVDRLSAIPVNKSLLFNARNGFPDWTNQCYYWQSGGCSNTKGFSFFGFRLQPWKTAVKKHFGKRSEKYQTFIIAFLRNPPRIPKLKGWVPKPKSWPRTQSQSCFTLSNPSKEFPKFWLLAMAKLYCGEAKHFKISIHNSWYF